eukprot:403377557
MTKINNLLELAIPSILALFFSYSPEFVNLHIIGMYGSTAEINGISLGNIILIIFAFTIMWGFCGSLDTFMSQAFGAKDFELAGHYLNAGRLLMVFVFIPMIPIMMFSDRILHLFQQDAASAEQARLYLLYMLPGIFFMYFYDAQRRLLQSFKMVKHQAAICFTSAIAHYIIAYVLTKHYQMGVIGLAYATSVGYLINLVLALIVCRINPVLNKAEVNFDLKKLKFGNLIRVGFFNVTMIGLKWYSFQYMILIAVKISVIDQIAFNNIFNFSYLIITIASGISNSFSQIIASSIGAKQYQRAKSYGIFVYQFGLPLAIFFCFVLYALQNQIVKIFGDNEQIRTTMLATFDLATLSLFFDFFQQLQLSMIRAIGLFKLASFTNFMAYELVLIPVSTLLVFHFDGSVRSLWIALITAYAAVNTLYFFAIWGCNCSVRQFKANHNILPSDESYEKDRERRLYMEDKDIDKDLKEKLI